MYKTALEIAKTILAIMHFIKLFINCNSPTLKEHMQYCINHPEEMGKLSKLKAQITEVKGIMFDNIEKVWIFTTLSADNLYNA